MKYKCYSLLILMILLFSSCNPVEDNDAEDDTTAEKPVIYLYPEETMDVSVELNYDGVLTYTYPSYNESWEVTAFPDGKLISKEDGREYSYLFWEGVSNHNWNFNEGFVVSGEDTEEFLIQKLNYMGLQPVEYNEFITYWVPRMKDNNYNLISFQEEEYVTVAELVIRPEPDSILRVFMTYKSLEEPIVIEEQHLRGFERKGFTVIEWGGLEIVD